jgi:hypothetical protein
MSWSIGYVCPDCELEFVVEDETVPEFTERHEETCEHGEYEGD